MFIAFIVLFPLGVITAQFFRNFTPWWFRVHIALQCLGWGVALIGALSCHSSLEATNKSHAPPFVPCI